MKIFQHKKFIIRKFYNAKISRFMVYVRGCICGHYGFVEKISFLNFNLKEVDKSFIKPTSYCSAYIHVPM